MKKMSFLNKLYKKKKLQLVEPSENVKTAYLQRSDESLVSAKTLLNIGNLKDAVALSYYSMYHCLLALLFRAGIKCENHTGAIMILKEIFNLDNLEAMLTNAKKERIDKQYYVADGGFTKEDAMQIIKETEQFILEVRSYMSNLNSTKIELVRKRIET